MKSRFHLPPVSKPKDVEQALRYFHDASSGEHAQHSYEWTRTHWFLQGVRKLLPKATQEYQVPPGHYTDNKGQRRIRIEKALHQLQTEMGRILALDLGPAIPPVGGVALDGVRKTAIANAALDSFWTRFAQENFRLALAYMLVAYGTCGIGGFEAPDKGGVYGATLMTIPPWELRPLPGGVTNVDQVGGVEWCRWVPYDWLKKSWGHILKLPKNKTDLNLVEVPAGSNLQGEFSPTPTAGMSGLGPVYQAGGNSLEYRDSKELPTSYVEVKESWVHGDDYSCLRWNIMLGDTLALDIDYGDEKSRQAIALSGNTLPIAPLHVARYLSVGSFWGRGLIDREINLNRELELAAGDMIQEARDSARTRIFMLPTSTGINLRQMENSYQRLQVMTWSPDYAAPAAKPEFMQPVANTGQMLGQVVGMINGFMDSTANQGPMFAGQAPGRVDSTGAIQEIQATAEIPFLPVSESITGAMKGSWKSILGVIRKNLKEDDTLTVTRIDESLIGLVFDRTTGNIAMAENPLPAPQEMAITIRSKMPISKAIIEQKLDKMLDQGLISPVQYRIAAFKHGLDLPFITRAEYENFVAAWLDIAQIIGDGKEPGEITVNDESCNHTIHLAVSMEVLGTPLFRVLSPLVQNALRDKKLYHLENVGAFPEPMANLDQFGNLSGPSPQQAQMGGMMVPPQPGQTQPFDIMGMM